MRIAITKGAREDWIAIERGDGSRAEIRFSKKGPVPHDAVHWFVERELGLVNGFWGMVAAGMHPEDIQDLAKVAGHARAKRAGVPDAGIVELLQAERLVECFEADLWSGADSPAAELVVLGGTACAYSHVPLVAGFDAATVERIRSGLGSFAHDWMAAPQGHVAVLEWKD